MGHQKPNTLHTFSEVSNILAPSNEPWQVELHDPATSVMTDFRVRALFKVDPEDTIDEALQKMKIAGLRIGFVVDATRSADVPFVFLATTDPQLAFRYEMPDESEYRE